ncbi:MAG: aminotransferase class V-fold PLP-dependent enzyme, partial [Ignavibacteria bacterium]|nr:aminotransferase class V-fold PLP-dependent enzyme [Ignavibacteria bacterium]
LDTYEISIPYGSSVATGDFDENILHKADAVFLTHVETSTATLTDIKSITKYIKSNSDALVITDAVTSIGAIEFRMDEWGIDIAVSASQKGMMTPPGLAVIAFNEKASAKLKKSNLPKFYFDLNKELKSQSDNLTTWTPSVGLFYGLDKAADIILEYGLEKWWKKTEDSARIFREFCIANGLKIFSTKPADSLTAFSLPNDIPSTLIVNILKEKYGIQIASGQAELRGKIARVSHMGDISPDDTLELTDIISRELKVLSASSQNQYS